MRLIVRILAVLLLLGQAPTQTDDEHFEQEMLRFEVEEARRKLYADRPRTIMFVVKAQYGDGMPVRGYISCDGVWCKFDEDEYCEPELPFKTDARGACIFNPTPAWMLTDEGESRALTCRAFVGLRVGLSTFIPMDGSIYTIIIPGSRP